MVSSLAGLCAIGVVTAVVPVVGYVLLGLVLTGVLVLLVVGVVELHKTRSWLTDTLSASDRPVSKRREAA